MPRSNLYFASDTIPVARPVWKMLKGSKYADSINTSLVLSSQPEDNPPIMPPSPKAPKLSAITHIFGERL